MLPWHVKTVKLKHTKLFWVPVLRFSRTFWGDTPTNILSCTWKVSRWPSWPMFSTSCTWARWTWPRSSSTTSSRSRKSSRWRVLLKADNMFRENPKQCTMILASQANLQRNQNQHCLQLFPQGHLIPPTSLTRKMTLTFRKLLKLNQSLHKLPPSLTFTTRMMVP